MKKVEQTNTFKLNNKLQLGCSTASTQIEGNIESNTWTTWFDQGKVLNNTDPRVATMHYTKYKEDTMLLEELGIKYYRMSLEWSRIEPIQGVFVEKEIQHYIDEIQLLSSKGINCLVTLHHFSNPKWFDDLKGFLLTENIPFFLEYVKIVVTRLAHLVNEWVTINEPNVYGFMGYLLAEFPPGHHSLKEARLVISNLVSAHISSYSIIHKIREELKYSDTKVGLAHHMVKFVPSNFTQIIFSKLYNSLFQDQLNKAVIKGKFGFFIKNVSKHKRGKYVDFLGLNYYTRSAITLLNRSTLKNVAVSDLNWEIYPKGLIDCATKLYIIDKLPIYITENGTCDDSDTFRSKYIYDHLKAISQSSLPISRYYYWCFCDNWEWSLGTSARFGIVRTNYETQERSINNSGFFYSSIIKEDGVTSKLYDKFVKDSKYNISK